MSRKRVDEVYIIYDEITGEYLGPDGWGNAPCDVNCYTTLQAAEKEFRRLNLGIKKIGAVIGKCGTKQICKEDNEGEEWREI